MCSLTKVTDFNNVLPQGIRSTVADPLKLDPKSHKDDPKPQPVQRKSNLGSTLSIPSQGSSTGSGLGIPTS